MLLTMQNAVKGYGDFRLDLSLELRPGYITGLVGQNGSGKTTAFKALLGLISLDGGQVSTLGKSPRELTPADRESIGVAMSDSGFSAYMTVKEMAAIQRRLYAGFDQQAFLAKCQASGLDVNKQVKDFSRGMRARVRLLCAMSHNARLLILDEPTSGLDVIAREAMLDELRAYLELDPQRGVLISSHIATDLESLCDDIYMIDGGSVILHEDTDRLLGSYGIIKIPAEEYGSLDKAHILRVRKETYGISCLTDDRAYYAARYPTMTIENGSIDGIITLLIKGERI